MDFYDILFCFMYFYFKNNKDLIEYCKHILNT